MSETKFTPGPWEVSGGYIMPVDTSDLAPKSPVPDMIRASGLMFAIAQVHAPTRWRDGDGRNIQEANAHLMAASPDMFAALQFCVERDPGLKAHPNVMAALSKASGTGE